MNLMDILENNSFRVTNGWSYGSSRGPIFLNIHTICCRCIKYDTFCMGDVVNSVYCRKRKNWTVFS